MHNLLAHLALFLHPWYRAVLWYNNGKTKQDTQKLLDEITQYKVGSRLFLGSMANGGLRSLHAYWDGIQHSAAAGGAPLQMPALATRVHDIKPHAAEPEKSFSLVGMFHTSRHTQVRSTTTTAMTAMKMQHTQQSPVKEVMLQKFLLCCSVRSSLWAPTFRDAEAVAAEGTAKDNEKDACDLRTAPSVELCSAAEMQVFNEYW